jgi:hypothetical protein
MKSKSIENHSKEEEGFESDDITLATKPNRSNSVNNNMELDQKMERLKKPSLERDFVHFIRIGLSGTSTNPHKLKARRDITQ